MKEQNLRPESIKEKIKAVFEASEHQSEALEGIYKLFIADWEKVKVVHDWPTCGTEMWHFICRKFQEFDKKHHPEVMAGGAWLNTGFSHNKNLKPWQVDLSTCTITRL